MLNSTYNSIPHTFQCPSYVLKFRERERYMKHAIEVNDEFIEKFSALFPKKISFLTFGFIFLQ